MDNHSGTIGESFRENLLIKSRNQNIFETFKLNRNLQRIPFKMMYNMSTVCHRFSNERWGRGAALNHLPLLFCKSVYFRILCFWSLPSAVIIIVSCWFLLVTSVIDNECKFSFWYTEVSAYCGYNLVYLCHSLVEQQIVGL